MITLTVYSYTFRETDTLFFVGPGFRQRADDEERQQLPVREADADWVLRKRHVKGRARGDVLTGEVEGRDAGDRRTQLPRVLPAVRGGPAGLASPAASFKLLSNTKLIYNDRLKLIKKKKLFIYYNSAKF